MRVADSVRFKPFYCLDAMISSSLMTFGVIVNITCRHAVPLLSQCVTPRSKSAVTPYNSLLMPRSVCRDADAAVATLDIIITHTRRRCCATYMCVCTYWRVSYNRLPLVNGNERQRDIVCLSVAKFISLELFLVRASVRHWLEGTLDHLWGGTVRAFGAGSSSMSY